MARSSVVTRACGKRVRFLIDTHVWLWAISANQRLRREAREVVEDPDNEVLLSVASAWEIGIKGAKGQLDLPAPAEVFVPEAIATSPTRFLEITLRHVLRSAALRPHHSDPFDRMPVAQAQIEQLPVLTADKSFDLYEISVIPAATDPRPRRRRSAPTTGRD
jgi:PIN domain nuclease of toxin-antitoxin system